ncbi:Gfo/Idh/MocA family protein [Sanguibacter suarezii]|uniref:Gfo/Idh/MocA family protein n=1 Tax=Sanguibacter suarezii TaxID=60921 RepID=UPI000A6E34CF|nr:Gfo/Idh/MocA family oxidoreductase [Sanguibacter suarezii]
MNIPTDTSRPALTPTDDRLRVGLVGYGGAGRGIHARLLRAAGHVVTVVVTRSPDRRAQADADWPGVRVVDDLDELLDARDAYDLVVLASPTPVHEEQAAAVLTAGVPLLMDKPIGLTADGAQVLVDLAEAGSVPFTVFQNRRWDPEQLTLRAVLESGEIGRVHRLERRWERFRPVPLDRWKENDPDGGGLLLDLGTHLVDSSVQLFGPVESVYAELRSLSTPTEDDVFLSIQHAGTGVVSHLWGGSLVGAPGPRTRVLGSEGAYVVTTFENDASPFELMDDGAPAGSEGWIARGRERSFVPRAPGGHGDFYPAVSRWLREGGPVPVDPRDAVHTARVLDAARVSAATGARCTVD